MQHRISSLFAFVTPYGAIIAVTYYLATKTLMLTALETINFVFFILQSLFLLPFLIGLITKFKLPHLEIFRIINTHIPHKIRFGLFVSPIVICTFAFIVIFYEYFVKQRTQGGIWQVQINIFISICNFILYSKTLMMEITSKIFSYLVYIILLLLTIVFLAHFSIIVYQPLYLPELCIQILVILIFLNCWWSKTPALMLLLMIAANIIAIEQFIRCLLLPDLTVVLVYRGILVTLFITHLILKSWQLIKLIKKCAQQIYQDDNKDQPLSNMMISQIPLVEYKKNESLSKQNKQQKMQQTINDLIQDGNCAICTMKIQQNCLIYQIPCKHIFHNQCLSKWLQLRNSCPTCRSNAI